MAAFAAHYALVLLVASACSFQIEVAEEFVVGSSVVADFVALRAVVAFGEQNFAASAAGLERDLLGAVRVASWKQVQCPAEASLLVAARRTFPLATVVKWELALHMGVQQEGAAEVEWVVAAEVAAKRLPGHPSSLSLLFH